MKTTFACGALAILAVHLTFAEPPKPRDSDGGTVSITLDNVQLRDFVRMVSRIAGVSFSFDPKESKFDESTSVDIKEKPWKPFFAGVLAQHGLVLSEDSPGSQTYSIIRAVSADAAARLHAAQEAVALADAVLADLNIGDVAAAKARLAKSREHNAEIVRTAQTQQRQEEPASSP
jgi:type II secretory pathway component GspD/PulD (secretin)